MSNAKGMPNYRSIAIHLINTCRNFVDAYNLIGLIGFYLVLHKQGKLNETLYCDVHRTFLDLGLARPIFLHDICRNEFSSQNTRYIVPEILNINPNEYSLAHIYEEVISILSNAIGRSNSEFTQPNELTELVSRLHGDTTGKRIYNPCAGIGSYQLANPKANFISQEINSETWAIGCIRLFLNGIEPSTFYNENSLEIWKGDTGLFDAIISTPPFGFSLQRKDLYPFYSKFRHNGIEGFMIERALNSLKENGTALFVVSLNFLFNNIELEFRKYMAHNGFIHSIILLPSKLFPFTSIPAAVIKITKQRNDRILMTDGSSFYSKGKDRNIMDTNKLLSAIENKLPKFVKEISLDELSENEFNLNPSLYTNSPIDDIEVPEGYRLCKLKELVSYHNGGRCKKEEAIFIKGQDLSNEKFDFIKTFQDLPSEKLNRSHSKLDKDLLLILRIGNLKPTLFKYNEEVDVCCNPNILSFEVNQELVYPQYLANELSKEYVVKQVSVRSTGIMPSISKKDFLEIEILIPALEKQGLEIQKAMFENEKYNFSLAKAKELGLESLLEKQRIDFIEEIRIKKHSLRQYIGEITSGVSGLIKYVDRNNLGNMIYSEVLNMTLSEHLKRLSDTIEEMESKFALLTQTNGFGLAEKVDIKKVLKCFKSKNNYQIEYLVDEECEKMDAYTLINKDDLKEVIHNIISNAVMHGFIKGRNNNIIRIRLSYDKEESMHVIQISNNGKHMPKGMDTKRFGIKGEIAGDTGNDGIGGYRVKSIVEHFKGSYSVENDPESLFPVQITIKLPKID